MLRTYFTDSLVKLVLYSCILFSPLSYADKSENLKLSFKHINKPQLDSLGEVWDIAQDQQGFMWFAGSAGLARYDGYSVKVYQHEANSINSLSNSFILDILITRLGQLWIATYGGGLNLYNPLTDSFVRYRHHPNNSNSLSNDTVFSLAESHDGKIWLATDGGGLNLFDPKKETFIHFHAKEPGENQMPSNNLRYVFEDHQGIVWLGTFTDGLIRFDPNTNDIKQYKFDSSDENSLSNNNVLKIYEDKKQQLWLGGIDGGLSRLDKITQQFIRYQYNPDDDRSLGGNNVYDIVEDKQGVLWIGTDGGGLNKFNPKTNKFIRYKNTPTSTKKLLSNKIRSLYLDKDDDLWLGHFPSGVSKIDPYASSFINFQHNPFIANSVSNNGILAIEENKLGDLWIGTEKSLNYLNRKTGKFSHYIHDENIPNSLSAPAALSLLKDNQDGLWIGTWSGGLNYFNIKTRKFSHYLPEENNADSLQSKNIFLLFKDNDKGIWLGTWRGGLNYYNLATKIFTAYKHDAQDYSSITTGQIRSIYLDRQKNFWIGTDNGLNIMDRSTGTFKHYLHNQDDKFSISSNRIKSIFEDSKENLWIGTDTGLNLFDRKTEKFTSYTKRDGLPNDTIIAILEDNQGYLWMSTEHGLSRFDPDTEKFRNYDVNHGLPGNVFNRPAYLKTQKGDLVFGSTKGITIFDPTKIFQDNSLPTVILTEFKLFNQQVKIGGSDSSLKRAINYSEALTLRHDQSVFSLTFAALNFRIPEKNQYAYKLEGFENNWNYVGNQRTATYTNLDAGDYVFRVKAANSDNVWNEQGTSLKITVLPPLWETWWAYLSYGLFLLSLVFTFIHSQRKKVIFEQNVNMQLERKVVERMSDIIKLGEIGKELTTNLDSEQTFEKVYSQVSARLDTHVFAIYLYSQEEDVLNEVYVMEAGKRDIGIKYSMNETERLAVWCVLEKRELITNNFIQILDFVSSALPPKKGDQPESIVYLPLIVKDSVVGCLTVQSQHPNAYSSSQIEFLRALASYTAIALDNAGVHQQLSQAHESLKETQRHLVLTEKMTCLGTLTAGVAHEINNPTNFAHAAAYLMNDEILKIKQFLKQLAGGDDAEPEVLESLENQFSKLVELTKTTFAGTARIKTIVEDLRTFARLDDAKQEQVDVSELINSTKHLVRSQYDAVVIDVNVEYEKLLTCFPSKLSQVFMNIIVNACQAIETMKKETPSIVGKIDITVAEINDYLYLEFQDNGCGMNEETVKKVFDPFFTTKDVGSGTGLGMAISFGIIEEHDGMIDITSTINEGSSLTIKLPI